MALDSEMNTAHQGSHDPDSQPQSGSEPLSAHTQTSQQEDATLPRTGPSRLTPYHPSPPSIISSRMTDIGSNHDDNGDEVGSGYDAATNPNRRSAQASDLASRPPTALTGVTGRSSIRSGYHGPNSPPQPLRKQALTAHKRRSAGAGSVASSIERASSIKSKSHVPSLTSHAFFRPMSSQKLQAQRAQGRNMSLAMNSVPDDNTSVPDDEAAGDTTANIEAYRAASGGFGANNSWRQSIASSNTPSQNPLARFASDTEDQLQPPGSRGTEITAFDIMDRFTANTSPGPGNRLTGSATDSTQPLNGPRRDLDGPGDDHMGRAKLSEAREEHSRTPLVPSEHRIVVDPASFRDRRNNAASPLPSPSSLHPPYGASSPQVQENAPLNTADFSNGAGKLPSTASSPRIRPVDLDKLETLSKHTPRSLQAEVRRQGRVHQYFEGNAFFCLGGRFQNSRQKPINIATGSMIVIPCVLFFIFEAPWLWQNLSPAVPITFAYLFYVCVSSFVHASVSDPGVSFVCVALAALCHFALTLLDSAPESPYFSCATAQRHAVCWPAYERLDACQVCRKLDCCDGGTDQALPYV